MDENENIIQMTDGTKWIEVNSVKRKRNGRKRVTFYYRCMHKGCKATGHSQWYGSWLILDVAHNHKIARKNEENENEAPPRKKKKEREDDKICGSEKDVDIEVLIQEIEVKKKVEVDSSEKDTTEEFSIHEQENKTTTVIVHEETVHSNEERDAGSLFSQGAREIVLSETEEENKSRGKIISDPSPPETKEQISNFAEIKQWLDDRITANIQQFMEGISIQHEQQKVQNEMHLADLKKNYDCILFTVENLGKTNELDKQRQTLETLKVQQQSSCVEVHMKLLEEMLKMQHQVSLARFADLDKKIGIQHEILKYSHQRIYGIVSGMDIKLNSLLTQQHKDGNFLRGIETSITQLQKSYQNTYMDMVKFFNQSFAKANVLPSPLNTANVVNFSKEWVVPIQATTFANYTPIDPMLLEIRNK